MKIINFHYISMVLVFIGSGFMLSAILAGKRTHELVETDIRFKWGIINSLMLLFLGGYCAFLYVQIIRYELATELITGVVFLGGAFFVLIVMQLINKTINQLNHKAQMLEANHLKLKETSEKLSQAKETLENVFNTTIPICITNTDHEILQANDSYYSIFGHPDHEKAAQKCFESRSGAFCDSEMCPLVRIKQGEKEILYDTIKKLKDGRTKYFLVTARPFLDSNKNVVGVLQSFLDIDERKRTENTKAELIEDLQEALDKVNLLRGLLPICASCKKIRDDKGYWNRIEEYIQDHSEAVFTHGLCPDCANKLYPEVYNEVVE